MLRCVVVDENGCFSLNWQYQRRQYTFTVDRKSASVVGTLVDGEFFIRQLYDKENKLLYKPVIPEKSNVTIKYKNENGVLFEEHVFVRTNDEHLIVFPNNCDIIEMLIPDELWTYTFTRNKQVENGSSSYVWFSNEFALDVTTGYLNVMDSKGRLFFEMWPCMNPPYLEGALVPNLNKHISVEKNDTRSVQLKHKFSKGEIIRNYNFASDNSVEITTSYFPISNDETIDPLFHLGFCTRMFSCIIYLDDETVIEKVFSRNDTMFQELAFEDFKKEEYSSKIIKSIDIKTETSCFSLDFDADARCFFQRNYMRVYPSQYKNGGVVKFGSLRIRKKM